MIRNPTQSRLFGDALAKHLGITEHGVTHVVVEGKPDALLTAVLTVAISADDLAAVSERMKAATVKQSVSVSVDGPVCSKAVAEAVRAELNRQR